MKQLLYSIVCGLLLLSSCNKNKDDELPVISIELPSTGFSFNDVDEVEYKLTVTDNKKVAYIKTNLVNADMQGVSITNVENYDTKIISEHKYLSIDATKINASGTYYLNVKAGDGSNEQSVYLPIFIKETALHRKAVFVITNQGTNGAEVQKIDSVYTLSNFVHLTGDFLAADVGARWKQFYSCGNYNGALRAIDTRNISDSWKVENIKSGSRYFSALHCSSNIVYVGFYEGFVQGYNEKGSVVFKTKTDVNFYAEKIYRHENYILCYEKHKSENKNRIKRYFSNGSANQELYVDFEPIAFLKKDNDECYILTNQSNQAALIVYNVENNSFYKPTILSGTLVCGTLADGKVVFCDGKALFTYTEFNNSLVVFKDNFSATKMVYDQSENELITLNNGVVTFLDFETGSIKKSIAVNSNASELLLQMSK